MFNFNNLSGYVTCLNFVTLAASRNGRKLEADVANLSLSAANVGVKFQLNSSYSVNAGLDLQIQILSGLTQSLLAVDAKPVTLTDTNGYYVKGLADILAVNSGNGVSSLTGNDQFKNALNVADSYDKAKTVIATRKIGSPANAHKLYSSDTVLFDSMKPEIDSFVELGNAIKKEGEVSNFTNFVDSSKLFTAFVDSSKLFTAETITFLKNGNVSAGQFLEDLKTASSSVKSNADFEKVESDYGANSKSWTGIFKEKLTFNKNDAAQCEAVKQATSKDHDAGGGQSNPSKQQVTFKVYKTSNADISMESIIKQTALSELKFSIQGANGEESSNADKFFEAVSDGEIAIEGDHAKAIFLIGLFGERDTTTSRSFSVALVPQFEIGASYHSFSLQGISFESAGLRVQSPVLAMVTDYVNRLFTFSITQPLAINVNNSKGERKLAFKDFSSTFLNVAHDKSIKDEALKNNDSDAFQAELAKHSVMPFAAEDQDGWFAKQNYGFNIFAKLSNPLFNVATGFNITYIAKGKAHILGISGGTTFQFIKFL